MIDQKNAEKLKRSLRKVRRCEETLCDCAKGEERVCCEDLLKARKAHKKLLDQVESA